MLVGYANGSHESVRTLLENLKSKQAAEFILSVNQAKKPEEKQPSLETPDGRCKCVLRGHSLRVGGRVGVLGGAAMRVRKRHWKNSSSSCCGCLSTRASGSVCCSAISMMSACVLLFCRSKVPDPS